MLDIDDFIADKLARNILVCAKIEDEDIEEVFQNSRDIVNRVYPEFYPAESRLKTSA